MPQILMLHRVLPDYEPSNYYFQRNTAISWSRFINLLDQIEATGMQTLPVSELGQAHSSRNIYLTFDDGYSDNAPALNEILKRGMKATLFPVKQFVQDGFSPIDDMAFHLMSDNNVHPALQTSLMCGRYKHLLRRISVHKYRYLRRRWFGLVEDAIPNDLFLTEQQLSGFVSRGIELGIHGNSHRIFTALSNKNLLGELNESKDWLQTLGANAKLSVCFPHGSHDQRTLKICSNFGLFLLGVDAIPVCDSVRRRIHIKEVC